MQEAENTCVHSGEGERPKLGWHARLTRGCLGPQIRVICWGRKFHQILSRCEISLTVARADHGRAATPADCRVLLDLKKLGALLKHVR